MRTRLTQEFPGLAYVRAVETQRRGLIHLHVVLWSPKPLDALRVQDLALAAGFGCVMDLAPLTTPEKAARYVGKYVTKSLDDRPEVPWVKETVDKDTGEVTRSLEATYRAWSSSQNWGIRMADLLAASRRAVAIAEARRREAEQDALSPDNADTTSPVSTADPPVP